MKMAMVHQQVRPLPPCRTSPPEDELRDPCAPSPSVPPPMATSAVTPCPTAMQPSLHDPASPRPAPSTTGVTSSLRRQRSQASSPRPACRSTDRFLIGSASYACNSKPRNDLQHRSAGCVASADAKASIDPIVCPATSWGPDRFYIELVSPLDACALLFSHLTQLAASLRHHYAQARGGYGLLRYFVEERRSEGPE